MSEEDTVYGDGAGRHFWEGATHVSAVDSVRKRWSTQGHGEADSSCFFHRLDRGMEPTCSLLEAMS